MEKLFKDLEELWQFGHTVLLAYQEGKIDRQAYNYLMKMCREQTELLDE